MSVIGLRVGPFEIVDEATVPEAGRWYRARRTGMTRRQPADVLVRLLGPDASAAERADLQRQFETLRALEDPRVPEPVAFYEGTGALAVAAVEGVPLSVLVDERARGAVPMTPATLLDLSLELAEALQHAHHKGRHHGHLSPSQVWIGAEGRLWLWGFGPGAVATPEPAWTPPERARGEAVSGATDQWCLAAVVGALVVGRPPWRGPDPLAEARRGDPAGFVAPIEAQWPALGRLLRRMLDPQPQNRLPSLHPVRQELLALARKAGGTSERREIAAELLRKTAPTDVQVEVESSDEVAVESESEDVITSSGPALRLPPAPAPAPAPAPEKAHVAATTSAMAKAPALDLEAPAVLPFVVETEPPEIRRPRRLPDEPLAVVRLEVDDDAETEMVDERKATELADELLSTEMVDAGKPSVDTRKPAEIADEESTGSSEATVVLDDAGLRQLLAAIKPEPSASAPSPSTPVVPPPNPTLSPVDAVAVEVEIEDEVEADIEPDPQPTPPPDIAPPAMIERADAEDTASNEMTTLFDGGALQDAIAEATLEEDRHPTVVPPTDPGSDPGPASAGGPKTDGAKTGDGPSLGDLDAPADALPPRKPSAIERVAPIAAGCMLVGMTLLLLWNWMH